MDAGPSARGPAPPARATLARILNESPRAHTRAELIAAASKRQLEAAIQRGAITRLLPGVYVGTRHRDAFAARADAALLWAKGRAILGGTSAAHLHGVIQAPPSVITLTVLRTTRLRAPDWIVVIQPSVDITSVMVRGARAVPVVDAVIQAWNQLPADRASSMVLDGARRERFRAVDLAERIADYPRIRGRRTLVRLLGELRGGIESYLEHLASTRVFNTRDFASFRRQTPVRACGQRFVLDMFHEHAGVAVELDGRAFHSDDSDRRRNLARDAILASVGITTIRLTFEDITQRPEWCRARVRNTLASARRRRAA